MPWGRAYCSPCLFSLFIVDVCRLHDVWITHSSHHLQIEHSRTLPQVNGKQLFSVSTHSCKKLKDLLQKFVLENAGDVCNNAMTIFSEIYAN